MPAAMSIRLSESGINLNDEAACALWLHAKGYRPSEIAEHLTDAISAARQLRSNPTEQLRPVISFRGAGGKFSRRAA